MTQIPAGWEETTLGERAEAMFSWGTPSTSREEYYSWEIPWVRTQEVNFNYINKTEVNITELGLKNSSAKWIKKNTVIIAMYWNSAWRVAYSNIDATTNQACCNFFGNKSCDNKFVFFNLMNRYKEILWMANWAAQQNLSVTVLKQLPIHLPPLPEQQAIAAVLSSFDDKIELLRAENQTLEQMGQELFKERFGKWKIGDELPEGWRVGKLGEIWIQITQKVKEDSDRVVLSAVNTGNLVLSEEYFSKQVYSNSISKYIVCNKWDFAYNPARINIWSIWRNSYWNGAVSPVYVVFSPKEGFGRFLEYIFKSRKFNDHVAKYSNWSVRQALNYDWFSRFELIIPWNDILVKFNNTLQVFEKKIKRNLEQIQTLWATRDQLLPKLMSGEVRVEF